MELSKIIKKSPIVFRRYVSSEQILYLQNKYNTTTDHINTLLWCYQNNLPVPKCKCGKEKKLKSFTKGFYNTCLSKKCINDEKSTKRKAVHNSLIIEKQKQTKLKRYGDEKYNNREKAKQTCLEKYNVPTNLLHDSSKNKIKQTKLERYGNEKYNNREKAKQTKLERYGNEKYNNREKAKQTKLERYGNEKYNNREKAKQTCLEKYGIRYPIQKPEYKQKAKQTKLERYGNENYVNSKKAKQTNLEKYGISSFSKTPEYKQKAKQTKLERYGNENYVNSKKAKQTNLEKYGIYNYNNREKAKQTCLEKYGTPNFVNTKKAKQTCLEKYGTEYYSQKHISKETIEKINNKDWLIEQHHDQKKSILQISKELGDIRDSALGHYFRKHNIDVRFYFSSYPEKQIIRYVKEIFKTKIITNNRSIISPYEIDIYLPEYKLAIEFNGFYWHRPEVYGGYEQWIEYHQNKIDMCNEKGIKLLHLWENYLDHYELIDQAMNGHISNNLEQIFEEVYVHKK